MQFESLQSNFDPQSDNDHKSGRSRDVDVENSKQAAKHQVFAKFAAQILKLAEDVASKPNKRGGCLMLVNRLCELLSAKKVIVAARGSVQERFEVLAISGADCIDVGSSLVRHIIELTKSSIDRGEPLIWSRLAEQNEEHAGVKSVEEIAVNCLNEVAESLSADTIVCIPLLKQEESNEQTDLAGSEQVGFLIIAGDEEFGSRDETWFSSRMLGGLFGSLLSLQTRAEQSWWQSFRKRTRKIVRGNVARTIAAATIVLSLVMLIPIPHKISTDCVLQPVSRRFVSAPFDAKLSESFVRPGDVVEQGDLIARLDDNEVRMELSSLRAALQRESKRFDAALATRNVAESQIAKHEIEKLRLDIELKESRLAGLEITSPVSGVVVSGDLKKSEGTPLTVGQTMFEIAPLAKMVVELHVPEEDISYVTEEMPVSLRTDAHPFRPFCGTITRVHPRSEIRDEASVFIAELELDNADDALRPGMSGSAQVIGPRKPLGWILFHRAWEQTVFFLIN